MPLSYSQLQCYRRCPKQYEFAFVKKVSRQISQGESFGSSMHNTLKKWGELELLMQAKKPASGQIALFTDDHTHAMPQKLDQTMLKTLWRQCFIAQGYETRAAMDMALLRGERALEHFFGWWSAKSRDVVACEKGFSIDVPGNDGSVALAMSGRFDRVERTEQGLLIIDFKSGEPRPQAEIDVDLQLSMYAAAAQKLWNEPVYELILLFIGEEGIVEGKTTRNASQIKDAMTAIRNLAQQIESKDFRATPTVGKCRSCPYREMCPARAV